VDLHGNTYKNMSKYKIKITLEPTEEEIGLIHQDDEEIELVFEKTSEMPVIIYDWMVDHVGNRPRDRG